MAQTKHHPFTSYDGLQKMKQKRYTATPVASKGILNGHALKHDVRKIQSTPEPSNVATRRDSEVVDRTQIKVQEEARVRSHHMVPRCACEVRRKLTRCPF